MHIRFLNIYIKYYFLRLFYSWMYIYIFHMCAKRVKVLFAFVTFYHKSILCECSEELLEIIFHRTLDVSLFIEKYKIYFIQKKTKLFKYSR